MGGGPVAAGGSPLVAVTAGCEPVWPARYDHVREIIQEIETPEFVQMNERTGIADDRRGTVSVVSMESPLDIFLHEGVGQLRRVGLEETPKGFCQQVVQISRAALGDESLCLRRASAAGNSASMRTFSMRGE